MSVAHQEAMNECGSDEAKKRAVADDLGLDSFPDESTLDEGPQGGSLQARKYVFARLFYGDDPLLDDDADLYSAKQEAWAEVDRLEDEDAEEGGDGEPDEEEADEGEEDEDTDAPEESDDPGEEAGVDLDELDESDETVEA